MEIEELIALAGVATAFIMFAGLIYQRGKDQQAERERKHRQEMAEAVWKAEVKRDQEYAERERKRIEAEFHAHSAQSPELMNRITTLEMMSKGQDAKIDALDQKFDRRMDSLKDDIERIVNGRNH